MPPKSAARGEYIETVRSPIPSPSTKTFLPITILTLTPSPLQDTGNKISRRALLHGTPHIVLAGKSVIQHDVVIRGDLVRQQSSSSSSSSSSSTTDPKEKTPNSVSIHLGRYVFVSPHCTLHPPSRLSAPHLPASSSSSSSSTTTTAISVHTPIGPQPAGQQTLTYFPLRIADFVYIGPHTHVNAATIGSHVSIGAHCTVGNMVVIKDNVRVLDYTVLPAGSVWASGSVVGGRPGRVVGELGEGWGAGGVEGGPGMEARELWRGVGNASGGVAGKR
jgi:dynactin-5